MKNNFYRFIPFRSEVLITSGIQGAKLIQRSGQQPKMSTLSILCILLIFTISCSPEEKLRMPVTNLVNEMNVIPVPRKIIASGEAFPLTGGTEINYDPMFKDVGEKLSIYLDGVVKQDAVEGVSEQVTAPIIFKKAHDSLSSHREAYEIRVMRDSLLLYANTAEGAYRGVQTLKQIIPRVSNDTLASHPIWPIAGGIIRDWPQFQYRGAMLDVSRHFFTVDEVKRYMDLLSFYKINRLHLHLSDDQGWRIEIKGWPELTGIGAATEVGGGPGGYYSQEDFKDLVEYAAKRHIMIIPEIDMPGHTNAASVAYPFLNGNGKRVKPYHGTRVGFSTFATRKDTVYRFIDDVVREISAISPSLYFHIGGDESHVTKKDDYKYFVSRVQEIVRKHGKRMIGWDEISQAPLDSTAIAQFWNREDNTTAAAEKGMQIILSPAKKAYLDMKYDSLSKFGLDWAGHITLETAYNWDPQTYVPTVPTSQLLGLEAPLWSETISNSAEMEYLAFPRIIAYAELAWSPAELREWEDFKERLAAHQVFLNEADVNYYPSPSIPWRKKQVHQKEEIK